MIDREGPTESRIPARRVLCTAPTTIITTWSLTLLLLCLVQVTEASLPSKITYFVTVRSFMAAQCRTFNSTDAMRDLFCPDDPDIIQQMQQGLISGHPDFERLRIPRLFTPVTSATHAYNTSFAQFGRQFPLTATWDIGNIVRPFVLSQLEYGSTGIGKMRYCLGEEGYLCDFNQTSRTVMDQTSFATWYHDSQMFNRRMGYRQNLYLDVNSKGKYVFDASNVEHNPQGDNLYAPISQQPGLLAKGWPLSPYEKSVNRSCQLPSCVKGKYWFTTEIHTSFQYLGGEQFRFSGDDDVHIFINGRLAINLGGEHSTVAAEINLDTYAEELNLTKGEIYSFDLFHAERQTNGSNYALTTTLAQVCNVITSDFRSNGSEVAFGIDWTSSSSSPTRNEDWFILGGPGFGFVSEPFMAVLMSPDIPNVVSYMFHRSQQNIGSGFSLSFSFRMTGAYGNGFAVLVHDRPKGLSNLNGGTGPNLGLRNLENSFAIVFDMCPSNENCSDDSLNTRQQIRLHYPKNKGEMNENTNRTRRVFDPSVLQNWKDGDLHTVQVFYYAIPDWLEVYVDDSLRLVERGFSVSQVIGNRNAFVGFVATSSQDSKLRVEIGEVSIKTVKVKPDLSILVAGSVSSPAEAIEFVADGQQTAGITLQSRDACGNDLRYGGLSRLAQGRALRRLNSNNNSSSIRGQSRIRRLEAEDEFVTYPAEVVDHLDGTYAIQFRTRDEGEYAFHAAFGDNCTWNDTAQAYQSSNCFVYSIPEGLIVALPFITPSPTESRDPKPVDLPWNIIYGVGIGLGGIMLCIFCWAIVLLRYRNKWRREKKFVNTGQQAMMDNQVELSGNPLGKQMQDMAYKVQETKEEVLKWRAVSGIYSPEPENLEKQAKSLKDELKQLKRKQQEEEVMEISKSERVLAREQSVTSRVGFKPEPVSGERLTAMDVLASLPAPPPTMNVPPVFIERHDPRATFLVSIARRDVQTMMDFANDRQQVVTGGNIFGQFYENGDGLVMHCVGPGAGAVETKESFVQSPSFVSEASDFLGKHSAFMMGCWFSTSVHGKPVSDLLAQAEEMCRSQSSPPPKFFLCLLVQLCGIKHEKMVVTISVYRFVDGQQQRKQNVGDLYVFDDDTDSEARKRHDALEVMRNRPPPPQPRDDSMTMTTKNNDFRIAAAPKLPLGSLRPLASARSPSPRAAYSLSLPGECPLAGMTSSPSCR